MKSLIYTVITVSVIGAPVLSFAQSNGPITRTQVREELIQLEQAGYRVPVGNNPHYPEDIQAAQARVTEKNAQAQADMSGYGSALQSTSESGAPASMDNTKSLYFGQ
ncbi:MAG: DUF4148 domain-containing protein [Trinickia sp.]